MQLDLFSEPSTESCILFDLDLGDHVARAVAHLGKTWVYHATPGPAPYSGTLERIDELPGGLNEDGVRASLTTAVKVWPLEPDEVPLHHRQPLAELSPLHQWLISEHPDGTHARKWKAGYRMVYSPPGICYKPGKWVKP